MWLPLAVTSAVAGAATSFTLKGAVRHGGVVVSTATFRLLSGFLLLGVVLALGAVPTPPAAYWRAAALTIPPEAAGVLCMALALQGDDLSRIQPIFGFIPLFVTFGGMAILHETPSALGATGIALVTIGVYCTGLQPGASAFAPLTALVRARASWYALLSALFFSITSVMHKFGIAAVGPLPWGATLAFGSAVALLLTMPILRLRTGGIGLPLAEGAAPWGVFVALAAIVFAVQQIGLQLSLRATQAGYVIAISATSTLIATVLGVLLLGERSAVTMRIAGALLVTAGAVCIALGG